MSSNVIPFVPGPDAWDFLDPDEIRNESLASAHEEAVAERTRQLSEDPSIADELRNLMMAYPLSHLREKRPDYPHLFRLDKTAAFPLDEASIIGGPGREGKTSAILGVAVLGALGRDFGGLSPDGPFSTIIVSGEDSWDQYGDKLNAQVCKLTEPEQRHVQERVRVVDMEAIKAKHGPLVIVVGGQAAVNEALLEAMTIAFRKPKDGTGPRDGWDAPLRCVVLETVSTLSNAEEDNPGLRVMAEFAKRLARALGVAVLISHHTSQASGANLRTLDVSQADIRGGTVLIDNTRGTWLLVNLGSEIDPFGEKDARTLLRAMVAPGIRERVSALICLDSSKAMDPPPVFFRWEDTRQVMLELPRAYLGMHWRRLHRELGTAKAQLAEQAKDEQRADDVRRCVSLTASMAEDGKQATVAAVSQAAGKSKSWAGPYLQRAVELNLLRASDEHVPRTRGLTRVYRPMEDL